MIEAQLEQDWRNLVQRFGMSEEEVEKFMKANGGGKQEFMDARRNSTEHNIKVQLILDTIKEEQNFTVTDDELDAEIKKYAQDITKDNPNYDAFKMYAEDDIKFAKARDYILENNSFKSVVKDDSKKESSKKTTSKKKDSKEE